MEPRRVNRPLTTALAGGASVLIIGLNAVLIYLAFNSGG